MKFAIAQRIADPYRYLMLLFTPVCIMRLLRVPTTKPHVRGRVGPFLGLCCSHRIGIEDQENRYTCRARHDAGRHASPTIRGGVA